MSSAYFRATLDEHDSLVGQSSRNWRTRERGKNEDEYQIYVEQATKLGWELKTYEEWLNS